MKESGFVLIGFVIGLFVAVIIMAYGSKYDFVAKKVCQDNGFAGAIFHESKWRCVNAPAIVKSETP